jgi:hypothetical protein
LRAEDGRHMECLGVPTLTELAIAVTCGVRMYVCVCVCVCVWCSNVCVRGQGKQYSDYNSRAGPCRSRKRKGACWKRKERKKEQKDKKNPDQPFVESLNDVLFNKLNSIELISKSRPIGLNVVRATKQLQLASPRSQTLDETVDLV